MEREEERKGRRQALGIVGGFEATEEKGWKREVHLEELRHMNWLLNGMVKAWIMTLKNAVFSE